MSNHPDRQRWQNIGKYLEISFLFLITTRLILGSQRGHRIWFTISCLGATSHISHSLNRHSSVTLTPLYCEVDQLPSAWRITEHFSSRLPVSLSWWSGSAARDKCHNFIGERRLIYTISLLRAPVRGAGYREFPLLSLLLALPLCLFQAEE